MQLDRLRRAQVAASVLRRARAGVLQTFQKWPEIAGSKYGELAKPGERFQRLSPKAVVRSLCSSAPPKTLPLGLGLDPVDLSMASHTVTHQLEALATWHVVTFSRLRTLVVAIEILWVGCVTSGIIVTGFVIRGHIRRFLIFVSVNMSDRPLSRVRPWRVCKPAAPEAARNMPAASLEDVGRQLGSKFARP